MSRIDFPTKHLVLFGMRDGDVHVNIPSGLVAYAFEDMKGFEEIRDAIQANILRQVNAKRPPRKKITWEHVSAVVPVDDAPAS